MNLLYMVFGNNTANHIQAAFSIYSFLTERSYIDSINIITDAPAFYNHLTGSVHVIVTNEQMLKEWRGDHDFFWRIKIKALELITARYAGQPVVYLDSDTFWYGDIMQFAAGLKQGKAFMHENEGTLSNARSKTERKMWQQVRGKKYGTITIARDDCMWNAGVVATPNTAHGQDIQTALRICDEMCRAGVTRRLIEQFALSLALDHTYDLQAADKYIAHYWSNKAEWNAAISNFLLQQQMTGNAYDDILKEMETFPYTSIPVFKRVRSTEDRLKKAAAKFFPPSEVRFLD